MEGLQDCGAAMLGCERCGVRGMRSCWAGLGAGGSGDPGMRQQRAPSAGPGSATSLHACALLQP